MIAVVIPLWVPAAFICLLCLLPDLIHVPGRAARWLHDRRRLAQLWADEDPHDWRRSSYRVTRGRSPSESAPVPPYDWAA